MTKELMCRRSGWHARACEQKPRRSSDNKVARHRLVTSLLTCLLTDKYIQARRVSLSSVLEYVLWHFRKCAYARNHSIKRSKTHGT